MRNGAVGTVVVNRILMLKHFSQRCIDRAVAIERYPLIIGFGIVVKTKIGTGTPVAVEMRDIVAFGLRRIKQTKISLFFYHVFKLKILYNLLWCKIAFCQFSENMVMFFGVGLEPFGICHKGIIAKKNGEIL